MNWFSFSLISITALAVAELLQQRILHTEQKFDEMTSIIFTFFVQALFTLPIILFFRPINVFAQYFSPQVFPYILLVSILGFIALIFYLKSFQVENISISTIFMSLSAGISTILGVIFLGESLYLVKIVGILMILVAILGINLTRQSIEKNNYYALLAGLFFGASYTLDKMIVIETDYLTYLFVAFLFLVFFGVLFGYKKMITQMKDATWTDYKSVVISSLAYLVFNLSTFRAYSLNGEVGRIDAINNSQVFLIILVEYFIYKQKNKILLKLLAFAIAFTGVIILGFY